MIMMTTITTVITVIVMAMTMINPMRLTDATEIFTLAELGSNRHFLRHADDAREQNLLGGSNTCHDGNHSCLYYQEKGVTEAMIKIVMIKRSWISPAHDG